jgi:ribose/xylose/arabinose/galactoside ABC-type transport system permease subunit
MLRNFWKATLISVAVYTAALLAGLWGDLRITLFVVPALQVTWTLFCVIRIVQLWLSGGYRRDAPPYDRESYGFALGGSVSSVALLAVVVVLTQVV